MSIEIKLDLNGDFEENRKKLNDALGIDHEEQTKQIESMYKQEVIYVYFDENGDIKEL